jgi:hypothetical protein
VLAFAVEWRGLRAPGWEADRACSMRLMLMEDGTYRTDFGAMEDYELGEMRLVTGYAGPGRHAETAVVDASTHSFRGQPVARQTARVAGEEFGPGKRSDLGHLWVRWMGYPQRLDPPGPVPVISGAKVTKGKLVMGSAGSNIAAGARALVDGVEAFTLAPNGKGTKWVVKKTVRSTPGSRTIAELFATGVHTLVVENPDGVRSDPVSVGR